MNATTLKTIHRISRAMPTVLILVFLLIIVLRLFKIDLMVELGILVATLLLGGLILQFFAKRIDDDTGEPLEIRLEPARPSSLWIMNRLRHEAECLHIADEATRARFTITSKGGLAHLIRIEIEGSVLLTEKSPMLSEWSSLIFSIKQELSDVERKLMQKQLSALFEDFTVHTAPQHRIAFDRDGLPLAVMIVFDNGEFYIERTDDDTIEISLLED